MKIQESQEMYLETILELLEKNSKVRAVDIVKARALAKSSVSQAVKSLKDNKYILIDVDGYITLTDLGLEIAKKVFEKHQILTKFLTSLGVDQKIAEDDACRIEHVISEETFSAIKSKI